MRLLLRIHNTSARARPVAPSAANPFPILDPLRADLETQGGAGGAAAATGCFLVARLYPSTSSSGASGSSNVQLPPGQDSRLVATASVSLSAQDMLVRRLPPPNPPPAAAAYISNMAVDPKFRRQVRVCLRQAVEL